MAADQFTEGVAVTVLGLFDQAGFCARRLGLHHQSSFFTLIAAFTYITNDKVILFGIGQIALQEHTLFIGLCSLDPIWNKLEFIPPCEGGVGLSSHLRIQFRLKVF